MTKFNLFSSVTNELFSSSDEQKNFEAVLKAIDPDKIPLFRDDEKLEEVFLNNNIHKFAEKKFRVKLLEGAFGTKRFNDYVFKRGLKLIPKSSTDKEKVDFLEKIEDYTWTDNQPTQIFIDSFELGNGFIPKKTIESDIEILEKPSSTYYQLFDYQSEIFLKTKSMLFHPSSRQIIRVPTGGGKTKIAMEIVTDFLILNEDSTVVWLAETSELLEQATSEFKKIWSHRGNKNIYLNRAWGTKSSIKSTLSGSKIIIAGLPKMLSFLRNSGKLKANLIVFDEAHHAAAPQYSKAIDSLSNMSTKVLGLTATPGRGQESETKKLSEIFNDNVPIQIDTHDQSVSPIKFLQRKGVLAQLIFKNPIAITEISEKFTQDEINTLLKVSEYNDRKILYKIGKDHLRNVKILKILLELAKNKKHVLYFGTSVEQSHLMYMLLTNFGIKAGVIDEDTPEEYRVELISKFQKKEIQILLNFRVLVAGFDAPAIDTIVIARPTKSANTLMQMIGRGMRGPIVEGGTESCDIYHVKDEFLSRFQNFDELYRTYDEYYEREDFVNR